MKRYINGAERCTSLLLTGYNEGEVVTKFLRYILKVIIYNYYETLGGGYQTHTLIVLTYSS